MKLFSGTRPLKRWRYIGVFGAELSACAAHIQVGPARQSFWALSLPGQPLRERTRRLPRRGEVELSPASPPGATPGGGGHLALSDLGVSLDLALQEEAGIEALCAHGAKQVWTRKQAGVRAQGTLTLDGGAPRELDMLAVIDDTAGYHSRVTEWHWTAGVGRDPDGVALAWNLVSGVNDPDRGSERAVWVAGSASETPPVRFARDLSSIVCEDGSQLRFQAGAQRSRSENLLIVRSDYHAPFGSFSGTLPGGITLASGHGVVEHHRARW